MNVIIVDDEESSRKTLRNYINKYCQDLDIVGEAPRIDVAKEIIETENPDLVFLDVEMPFGNGFDLLEQLEEIHFDVIFVTAYSHYAIDALNMSASYYLLKPLDIDELIKAVEKVKERRSGQRELNIAHILKDNLKASTKQLQKIVLPEMHGFEVTELKNILYCKANDNLTDFYFENGKRKTICKTLKSFDELLKDAGFMRIHKSTLINLEHVNQYLKGKNGSVKMADGSELEIASRRKKEFLDYFTRGVL
jgi:two-component system LytT family response regulator